MHNIHKVRPNQMLSERTSTFKKKPSIIQLCIHNTRTLERICIIKKCLKSPLLLIILSMYMSCMFIVQSNNYNIIVNCMLFSNVLQSAVEHLIDILRYIITVLQSLC